jgi:hypothetical protein
MTLLRPVSIMAPICFVLAFMCVASARQTTQSEPPVTLEEIARRGIIGPLGAPLGTVVLIEGEVVPNTSRAKIDASVPLFLHITVVDGKALAEPIQYRFTQADDQVNVKRPKVGDKFRYRGYETGEFTGTPTSELNRTLNATTEFHFATRFAIIEAKSELPR